VVAAENLFHRRQLAMHAEPSVKPRCPDVVTRASLFLLSTFGAPIVVGAQSVLGGLQHEYFLVQAPG
jgi:hypothetical protein